MPVDLHVHTTASDGVLSPSDVVTAAVAAGLTALAITDHDTVAGVEEALMAAAGTSLTVVPGVELSADVTATSDVHILGLGIEHRDKRLRETLAVLRTQRETRARSMVDLLVAAGHAIDFASVARIAGSGSVGRVHIARALIEAGSVPDIDSAFKTLIGAAGPFYVAKDTLGAAEAVAAIHGAGGVAVLAHPGVSGEAALVPLIDAGLDGIEAFHAEHDIAQQQHFVSLARRHGLLVTGGSDFHGPSVRSAPIGGGACPDDAVEILEARATLYRR